MELPKKESQVVLDTSLITYVSRLPEVIRSGGIFNQSEVNVIFAVFFRSQVP
jgi:hypothetical protein